MSPSIPALVVGCGNIGSLFDESGERKEVRTHASALMECPDTELVALCDHDPVRLEAACSFWGVTSSFLDYRDALNEVEPVVVCVTTPDSTHFSVCMDAIKCPSVRVLVVEKPLATVLGEAEQLVAEAAKHEVKIVVNYSRRFSTAYQRARDEICSGRIGRIELVQGNYSKGLLHNGGHWLDLARWFVGDFRVTDSSLSLIEMEGDPNFDLRLEFDQGARGFLVSVPQDNFFLFEMDLIGSSGRLKVLHGSRFEWYVSQPDDTYSGFLFLRPDGETVHEGKSAMSELIENAVACVRDMGEPRCSSMDAISVLRLVNQANQLCSM